MDSRWNRAMLHWNQGMSHRTIPIDEQGVFTFQLAPGYKKFQAFCAKIGYDTYQEDQMPCCMPTVAAPFDDTPDEDPKEGDRVDLEREEVNKDEEVADLNGKKPDKPCTGNRGKSGRTTRGPVSRTTSIPLQVRTHVPEATSTFGEARGDPNALKQMSSSVLWRLCLR